MKTLSTAIKKNIGKYGKVYLQFNYFLSYRHIKKMKEEGGKSRGWDGEKTKGREETEKSVAFKLLNLTVIHT